jgi:hypothetical protein
MDFLNGVNGAPGITDAEWLRATGVPLSPAGLNPAVRAAGPVLRLLDAAGSCRISAAAKGKLPSFEGIAYTGTVIEPAGYFGRVVVDLDGLKVPQQHRPVLRQHDHEQIVGHTTEVKAGKDGLRVAGVFSGEEQHRKKVVEPAKNGFRWQLSIGGDPQRIERLEEGAKAKVNGREVTGPCDIAREFTLKEISFVALGADGDTSADIAAQHGTSRHVGV